MGQWAVGCSFVRLSCQQVMTSNYIRNLEFSVSNLVKKNEKQQVNAVSVRTKEEMVHCWMTNLVKQEGQEEKVINLARRCMTRFLDTLEEESFHAWSCSELLAATCLLVTSKIVSAKPLTGRVLLKYSGDEFNMEELMSCELLVLSKLGWDVYLDCQEDAVERLDNLSFRDT